MTAAMAWRAKYRKTLPDGKVLRAKLRIESLGVHLKNRGGVYPAGVRCKSLCEEAIEVGFVKEELNHAGVAVEETPTEDVRSRGVDYVTGSTYNIAACNKDELLLSCFAEPYHDVRHTLLGHNHMMLVLRAFLTKAKWNLPPNEKKNIYWCDEQGQLSVAKVVESPSGKELAEAMLEGLDCEVLSWKMDEEEPTAASVISCALNKGHEIALRTTELTAVAVLKGEIIVQSRENVGKGLGQRVAFGTVRERVRAQLDSAADDPDLTELFDFLMSAGVGKNSYIEDLLEFGGCFVDSKKRQLRFSAFAAANKICEQAPWSKIAVMKRAYRKKPVNGFCPCPEQMWGDFEWTGGLQLLEDLLRFFHGTCASYLAKLSPQSRQKLLANIDVAAADAFFVANKDPKQKHSIKNIQNLLLQAVVKYLEPLGITGTEIPSCESDWIDFTDVLDQAAAKPASTSAGEEVPTALRVVNFDETTGRQLNTQVVLTDSPQQKKGGRG